MLTVIGLIVLWCVVAIASIATSACALMLWDDDCKVGAFTAGVLANIIWVGLGVMGTVSMFTEGVS